MTPRRALLVVVIVAALLSLACQRTTSDEASGGAASPAAAPVSAGASDLTLEDIDVADPLASLGDMSEVADDGDDLDQLVTDEGLDDTFIPDADPDFADLASPDFDREIDLGE